MSIENIEIRRLGHDEIINELFLEFKEFSRIRHAQTHPEDNEISEQRILESISQRDKDFYRFAAFKDGKIAGCISSGKLKPEHPEYQIRKHISWLGGFVLPEYRMQGIGSRLAKMALEMAYAQGVEIVDSDTNNEPGEDFLTMLDGRIVTASSYRSLDLSNFDWAIVDNWLKTPIGNLRLEYCPEMSEEFINRTIDISYASTLETKMMDNCEVPPTKEGEVHSLREYAQFMKNTSTSYHCLILADAKAEIVGFTEGTISQEEPNVFNQGMSMVWKQHRGNGYGKFLKASMLDHIRRNHPLVGKVSTGNNDLNAPMLAINVKLGFKLVRQWKNYRLAVADALAKLKKMDNIRN